MLTIDGLGLRIGGRAIVDGVSLSVAEGRAVAVVGPSGSGKTTLLRLVAGLVAPTLGTVAWGGRALSTGGRVVVPPEERGVGLLMQEGVLFPHLCVRDNVALGVPPGTPPAEARARVDEALAAARIAALADARPARLSGGEAQRVAIARAIAQRASVLLLDEPFHSLDAPVRAEVIEDVARVVRDRRLAALVVTHDVDEAAAIADEVVVLRAGRVAQVGTMTTIWRAPVDAEVARLFGPVGEIDADTAARAGVELPEGASGRVAFRPEAVRLRADDGGLRVTASRAARGAADVIVALPDGGAIAARVPDDEAPAIGARVRARVAWALPPSPGEPPR